MGVSVDDRDETGQTSIGREGRYRALLDGIDQGFCIFEMLYGADGRPYDYRFLEVNPTFERHTGLKDAVGRTARELVPGLEDHWVEVYARVAETGELHRFEQGSAAMARWFSVDAVRVGGAGSRQVALLFTDITDRRRAVAALQEGARRDAFRAALGDALRPLADAADIQAEAARLLGAYLDVRRVAYFEIAGDEYVVEGGYVAGSAPLRGRYPITSFGPKLLAALQTGRAVVTPDVAADRDLPLAERAAFAAIDVAAYIAVPLVKEGRFVAGLTVHAAQPRTWMPDEVVLVEETAERTWASAERTRAEAALRDSEARLRQLADAMPQLVWIADAGGTVRYYNGRAVEYAGLSPSDAGKWEWQPMLHPDDLGATLVAWERAMRERVPYAHEHRIRMADGSYRWHLSRAVPALGGSGAVEAWHGTATDIQDLKGAEAERQALLDALAHDLKNPLTALKMQAQLLQRQLRGGRAPGGDVLLDRIGGFERLATRMTTLLDELSDDGRARADAAAPPARHPIDLVALVRGGVEEARQSGVPHAIDLATDGTALAGDWDADQLGRVVGNLLENALKYSPDGGAVTVDLAREGDVAVLRVRDAGIGIPAADLPHIFDAHRRGGNVGAIAGSGVGLSSVRRIVERYGGTIAAESAPGRGTTMTVRLPLAGV
jgi:PAS domain S-box-containing protein